MNKKTMELKWLEDFVALSVSGNFRIAAEQRCVSQPAFSRRVQALEAWAGEPLIDRSNQPSRVTEAGEILLPLAKEIINLAKYGKEKIRAQSLKDRETIRFSTLSTLSQIFLPAWLKSLQPLIDTTQFEVKTEYNSLADYFAALENNSVDFFIYYVDPKSGAIGDTSTFESLTLSTESLVPVASPTKKGAARWWLSEQSDNPIPCLHTFADNSPWPIKQHMKSLYGNLNFRSVYSSTNAMTLKEMALEGFGMAWLPHTLVVEDLTRGRLVRVAEPAEDILVNINIYRCLNAPTTRVDEFWSVLLKQKSR